MAFPYAPHDHEIDERGLFAVQDPELRARVLPLSSDLIRVRRMIGPRGMEPHFGSTRGRDASRLGTSWKTCSCRVRVME